MSRRGALAFAAVLLALVAAGLVLLLIGESEDADPPPAPPPSAAPAAPAPVRGVRVEGARGRVRAATEPESAEAKAPPARLLVRVQGSGGPREPVAGAAVYVIDAEGADWRAVTADAGTARFDELPAGPTFVHTDVAGKKVVDRKVDLKSGEEQTLDVVAFRTGVVRGIVRDPDGRPVDTAWVHLVKAGAWAGAAGHDVTTGDDGGFEFADVSLGGTYTLTAGAPEWADSVPVEGVALEGDPPAAVREVPLRRHASLVVRVLGPDGRPVDATVRLESPNPLTRRGAGEYVRERVAPGEHDVTAEARDFVRTTTRVTVAPGEAASVELRFEEPRWIEGVVVDEAGAAVPRASVVAHRPDPDASGAYADVEQLRRVVGKVVLRSGAHAMTDADGAFRLGPLAEGDYVLTASSGSQSTNSRFVSHAPAAGVRITVAAVTRIKVRLAGRARGDEAHSVSLVTCVPGSPPNRPRLAPGGAAMQARASGDTLEMTLALGPDIRAICICGDDFAPVVVAVAPRAGELTDVGDVRVEAGVTFRGRVLAADGSPVGGADVEARIGPYMRRTTKSAADGTFALPHLAAGPAAVYAHAEAQFGAAVVDVAADAPRADVRLRVIGTLKGLVRGPDGAPVANAAVSIRHWFADDADDYGPSIDAVSDAEGRFTKAVAPGRCLVWAGSEWTRADVPEGGEASLTVTTR